MSVHCRIGTAAQYASTDFTAMRSSCPQAGPGVAAQDVVQQRPLLRRQAFMLPREARPGPLSMADGGEGHRPMLLKYLFSNLRRIC